MATNSPSPNTSPSATSPMSDPQTPPESSTNVNVTSLQPPLPTNATSDFSPIKKVTPITNATTAQSPPPIVSPPPAPPTENSPPPPSPLSDPLPPPPLKSPTPLTQDSEKLLPLSVAEPPESQPLPPESPSRSPPVAASPPPPQKSLPPPLPSLQKGPSPPPPRTPTPPQTSSSPPPPSHPPPPPIRPQVSPSQSPPVPTFSPPPPSNVQTSPLSSNATTNSTGGKAPEAPSSSSHEGLSAGVVAAIGVGLGCLLLVVIGVVFFFVRKRKKKRHPRSKCGYIVPTSRVDSPHSDSGLLKAGVTASRYVSTTGSELVNSPTKRGILGSSRVGFTYEELFEATNGFSKPNLLGEGGFGSVYKGYLQDGKEVAVKQLKIGGGQGEREFKAEVEIISRIHHRHLVSLAGYCIWESRRLLVYEYVPNNNLHFHLHGEGRPVMEWATRVKIAAGAARGIAYLHEDCHPRVIHRDIKSSNILLDNNFEAKVSDFGLAKIAADANTHISTRVVGTFGYMAPEYASTGKLTEKSDVYSFGVVLLELITGRKPVDRDESLVEWARPLLNKALETTEFEGLADPKLDKNYVHSEMSQVVEVAAACVRHLAVKRPRMGQVVRAFESMIASDITNGVPVGESEILPQSSEIRWFQKMAFGNQDFSTDFLGQSDSMNRSRSPHQV